MEYRSDLILEALEAVELDELDAEIGNAIQDNIEWEIDLVDDIEDLSIEDIICEIDNDLWNDDKWELMKHYQSPEYADWDDAIDSLQVDIERAIELYRGYIS